ncbi:MAG: CoA transferase, partial [Dehalococcoidia bacterium]|nr:CoA transferase [Dehalococcoidia bacterium]
MDKIFHGNRALDLTDHRGWLSGRILADLGVDVVKIEPPGGDPGRLCGAFYGDEVNPERSLHWFAGNLGKRGITLNLETPDGKEILKKLVKTSDFLLESFPPGYLQKLGLAYSDLKEINPGVIMVSLSPFGQTGPYHDYKATDIVAMAMGGFMYVTGDPDRAPLRISFPLAFALASAQAVAGALIAFHHRQNTGKGQHVDVSAQETVTSTLANVMPTLELNNIVTRRVGPLFFRGGIGQEAHQRVIWACRDGAIAFMAMGGLAGARSNRALVKWMDEEGMAPEWLLHYDWERGFDTTRFTQEEVNQVEKPFIEFFRT